MPMPPPGELLSAGAPSRTARCEASASQAALSSSSLWRRRLPVVTDWLWWLIPALLARQHRRDRAIAASWSPLIPFCRHLLTSPLPATDMLVNLLVNIGSQRACLQPDQTWQAREKAEPLSPRIVHAGHMGYPPPPFSPMGGPPPFFMRPPQQGILPRPVTLAPLPGVAPRFPPPQFMRQLPPGVPMAGFTLRTGAPLASIPVKAHTTLYVGKIASTVDDDSVKKVLELCGPVKSWKRAQDPTTGVMKGFGFCEYESAEGVLRAMRLLNKYPLDGQELMLKVNQATQEYLDAYAAKRAHDQKLAKDAKAPEVVSVKASEEAAPAKIDTKLDEKMSTEGNLDKAKEDEVKDSAQKSEANASEVEVKFIDLQGNLSEQERDEIVLKRLKEMEEERARLHPLPPPPPPPPADLLTKSPSFQRALDNLLGEAGPDQAKPESGNNSVATTSRHPSGEGPKLDGTGRTLPPPLERGQDAERGRDRDIERDVDRLEKERERQKTRREREREANMLHAERVYIEMERDWETRVWEKEKQREKEREKDREREKERRRVVRMQEDETDEEDWHRRHRREEVEEARKRRKREAEEDEDDRLKEEEEVVLEMKRRRLEQEEAERAASLAVRMASLLPQQQAKAAVAVVKDEPTTVLSIPPPPPVVSEKVAYAHVKDDADLSPLLPEEIKPAAEDASRTENGYDPFEEHVDLPSDDVLAESLKPGAGQVTAPVLKRPSFSRLGPKRMPGTSVFGLDHDEENEADKRMRPLVPLDYTEDDKPSATASGRSSSSDFSKSLSQMTSGLVSAAFNKDHRKSTTANGGELTGKKRGSEALATAEKKQQDGKADAQPALNVKSLIDSIPKTKDALFNLQIAWHIYDEHKLEERMRPWISKKIAEYLGEEEPTLVTFVLTAARRHVTAEDMLQQLSPILDDEAEMFVLKLWRMLIFEIKRVEAASAAKLLSSRLFPPDLVAQWISALDFGSKGPGFDPLRGRGPADGIAKNTFMPCRATVWRQSWWHIECMHRQLPSCGLAMPNHFISNAQEVEGRT
eukprot:SM000019S05133  [mRNA]  locus=s19:1041599:1049781:- [translate_table: standard]